VAHGSTVTTVGFNPNTLRLVEHWEFSPLASVPQYLSREGKASTHLLRRLKEFCGATVRAATETTGNREGAEALLGHYHAQCIRRRFPELLSLPTVQNLMARQDRRMDRQIGSQATRQRRIKSFGYRLWELDAHHWEDSTMGANRAVLLEEFSREAPRETIDPEGWTAVTLGILWGPGFSLREWCEGWGLKLDQ
jgi:hypothetical protein